MSSPNSVQLQGNNGVVLHQHKHNLKHRFQILRTLGEGTYGKVKLAIDKNSGEKVAIKYIRKRKIHHEQDMIRIQREIKIMSSLRHPHIVNISEVFENKEKIILVMEYAAGGELYDYINEKKVLRENEARKFFRQIVSAAHHCHQNGFVHRDLKLENIVLDQSYNAKIADFGLSNKYSTDGALSTYCGSPLYASPEIVNGQPYRGPEVDCWSLGVLLYTLVYGAMPFDGSDFKRLRKQITEGDFYEPARPSDSSSLIRQLLTVDPKSRATIEDICKHWWVNVGYSYPATEQGLVKDSVRPTLVQSSFVYSSDSDTETQQNQQVPNSKPESKAKQPIRGILKNKQKSKDNNELDLSGIKTALDTIEDHELHRCQRSPEITHLHRQFDLGMAPQTNAPTTSLSPPVDIQQQPVTPPSAANNISTNGTPDTDGSFTDSASKSASGVKLRSILKKRSKFAADYDPTKRYSYGSVGSNSSGDILDFSYDSVDGEHLFSCGFTSNVDSLEEEHPNSETVPPPFDLNEATVVYQQAVNLCQSTTTDNNN